MERNIKKIDKYTYITERPIGVGSFGKVYKGQNALNGCRVAIKQIDKQLLEKDKYLLHSLTQEIQVMKKLSSSYVVQLYDVLETTNNFYVISEYCEGGDLSAILKKQGQLGEFQALEILIQLLNGFQELVQYGIVHRDLKPDNILIKNKNYKIADFGFAKILKNYDSQMVQSLVGTPLYMSPQILKEEPYSSKTDIWSLGILYYQLIFGATPYPAKSQYQLIYYNDSYISEDSKDFIRKCLVVQEQYRFSWTEIYQHRLVKPYFQANQVHQKKQYILEEDIDMVNRIQKELKDIDISQINLCLETINNINKESIDDQQFQQFLNKLIIELTEAQIQSVFKTIDQKNSGKIRLWQFLKWIHLQGPIEQNNSITIKQCQSPQQKIIKTEKIIEYDYVLSTLNLAIQIFNLTLQELFQKFDMSKQNQMNFEDFTNMMISIKSKLHQEALFQAFQQIDQQYKGYVTIQNLTDVLNQESLRIKSQYSSPQYKRKRIDRTITQNVSDQATSIGSLSDHLDDFKQDESQNKSSFYKIKPQKVKIDLKDI